MTEHAAPKTGRFGLTIMRGRNPDEVHRASTPLELFFDLCFVVAVSRAAVALHHGFLEGHGGQYTISYIMVFFAIWWAWMNFTWFASAYDTDDWFYRIATFIQIAGVLILATGVSAALTENHWTAVTIGYLVMRVGYICQWIRVALSNPNMRSLATFYATATAVVQVGWLLRLVVVPADAPMGVHYVVFILLVAAEFAVPVLAQRGRPHMPWHPGQIAERYGLFTLIVLGESVLASANAVIKGVEEAENSAPLVVLAFAGLIIAFCMWWIYFSKPVYEDLNNTRLALIWGYGHYLVFASAAALSAGLELAIDYDIQHQEAEALVAGGVIASNEPSAEGIVVSAGEAAAEHGVHLDGLTTALLTAVPVAIYVLAVWWLMVRKHNDSVLNIAYPIAALAVLGCAFTTAPIHLTAAVMVVLVVIVTLRHVKNPPKVMH